MFLFLQVYTKRSNLKRYLFRYFDGLGVVLLVGGVFLMESREERALKLLDKGEAFLSSG